MNFISVAAAILLNMAVGFLLKPYTGWVINSHVNAAEAFYRKKKYKQSVIWGGVWCIFASLAIFVLLEFLIKYLAETIVGYAYALNIIMLAISLGAGQLLGVLKRAKKANGNTQFVRSCIERLAVPGANGMEPQKLPFGLYKGVVKIVAERFIMPLILFILLGLPGAAAYLFINYMAASDTDARIISHGYAKTAMWMNKVLNIPSYMLLSLILWAFKWVKGIGEKSRERPLSNRCAEQMKIICGTKAGSGLTDKILKDTLSAAIWCIVGSMCVLLCIYFFAVAMLAAAGLNEYWDFWSGN